MAGAAGKSSKGQKIGRAGRRPSTAAYKAGDRSAVNAKRKQAKHAKAVERAKRYPPAVPHGTARIARRAAGRADWAKQPEKAGKRAKPLSAYMSR